MSYYDRFDSYVRFDSSLSAGNVPIIGTSSAFEALFEGDVPSLGTLPAVGKLFLLRPEVRVAKSLLYALECYIPHFTKGHMLRYSAQEAVFATGGSATGAREIPGQAGNDGNRGTEPVKPGMTGEAARDEGSQAGNDGGRTGR